MFRSTYWCLDEIRFLLQYQKISYNGNCIKYKLIHDIRLLEHCFNSCLIREFSSICILYSIAHIRTISLSLTELYYYYKEHQAVESKGYGFEHP